jgi:DDE superfamily endonuclease/Helix-turn-helix of DDE superfamily endonuclease
MLNYKKLKDKPRDFLAVTGLTLEEFLKLLPTFQAAYDKYYPPELTREGKVRPRRAGGGAKGVLQGLEDKRMFILVYQKTNPLQTLHALQCDVSQPQAHDWMHHLLPVLRQALADLGLAPERDASRVATSHLALEGAPDLALDGTERRRQRPTDATLQQEHSSGKKKTHTDKNIVLVNAMTNKVVYLSPTLAGRTHDKKAADAAQIVYPTNATLDKDTGLQGYEPQGVLSRQPKKKPQGQALRVGDRLLNQIISGARVVVEHVLAGVQRCRIVKDVLRLTTEGISDLVMEIACGLHNLRISCRHPLSAFDVRSLLSSA